MTKRLLCCLGGWLALTSAWAQSRQKAEEPYEWSGGRRGEARYEYLAEGDQKIKDGAFEFRYQALDTADALIFRRQYIEGQYQRNQKHDRWRYVDARHDITIEDVVNFEVQTSLQSTVTELTARYARNVPQGRWELLTETYEGGRRTPTLLSGPLAFENGYLVGLVRFTQTVGEDSLYMRGHTDAEGYLDSTWTFQYVLDSVLVRESRQYHHGILLSLTRRQVRSGRIVAQVGYPESIRKIEALARGEDVPYKLGDRAFGLRFNNGYRRRAPEFYAQLPGNDFAEGLLRQLLDNDRGYFLDEKGVFVRYPLRTRRFEYPLPPDQQALTDSIVNTYDRLVSQAELVAEMNAFRLNRQRTDSLAFSYAFFQSLTTKLDSLDYLVSLVATDRFRYVDQNNYTRNGLEYIATYDTIRYEYDGQPRQQVVEHRRVLADKADLLSGLRAYLAEEEAIVARWVDYINEQLEQLELDASLLDIEDQILQKQIVVDSLYKQHEDEVRQQEVLVRTIRQRFLDERLEADLQRYAQESGYVEKTRIGERVLDMLGELEKIYQPLRGLYKAQASLDTLYSEEIFNPFTFTRYRQRAKERLYEAGEDLFSHYVRQLKQEKDYAQLKTWLGKIEKLHLRMEELAEEDTRKLERRLRRRNRPEAIESLLEI